MLMSPNKGETAVHGFHCPGDKSMRMREVLARPWVGICMHLALSLSITIIPLFTLSSIYSTNASGAEQMLASPQTSVGEMNA